MAPSLRDVSYILGIPVTGHVVTAEPIGDEAVKRMASLCCHKAWIYEYLPITQPQQKNQSTLLPRACRWNFGGATRGQRKKVMEWRKVFEQLQLSEASSNVNWNPYKDINPAIVPEYCIAADNICYSRTWLISFNIKEVYVPDRFARQFGREQGRLHGVPMWARRTWSKWKDWRIEYAREIEEFHQLVGCPFTPSAESNINSLPPDGFVAGENATGCSQTTSDNIASMVEDLKNDLPVIDRYLEGHLLPVEVASFLERVGTMIKNYSPPQGKRKPRPAQGQTGPVKSKNPRKRRKPSQFQDPSSAHQHPGALVPYQASKCDMVFDGTVPLLNGGEVFKEQDAMDPWQMSHLTMTPSSSSLDSSSPESRKRSRQDEDETQISRDADDLRRSGRLCMHLKMFKHRDGGGAEAANPIFH
nr:unnamed protein product [Digitaria exilis]